VRCCALPQVPREVLRHGTVEVRFMTWNQELAAAGSSGGSSGPGSGGLLYALPARQAGSMVR
jgi:hypothetical protein